MDKENNTTSSDRIWVHEFTQESAQVFCDAVIEAAEEGPGPIVIYIDSPGGEVHALASMVGVLDSIENPTIMVATGLAASAGAVLLSHGTVRCAGPHASIMVHELSGGAGGNINDVIVDTQEMNRLNEKWMGFLANNCGTTLSGLRKRFTNERRDIYLTPEAAVKFGLVDHIGIPTIRKSASFDLAFKKPVYSRTKKKGKK